MRALETVQKVDRRAQAIERGAGESGHNIITEIKNSFGPPLTAEEAEFLDQYVVWRRSNPISLTPLKA
jgi:hypothetical protein